MKTWCSVRGWGSAALGVLLSAAAVAHPSHHHTVDRLNQQLQEQPDSQQLFLQRGRAYSNHHQFEKAQADFAIAKQLGDAVDVAYDFGVLAYRQARFQLAIRQFTLYLEKYPGHIQSLEYRARVYRDAGMTELAINDFLHLFSVNDQVNPGHYVSVAKLMTSSRHYGADKALAFLDQVMAQRGIIPALQQAAIDIEQAEGNLIAVLERHRKLEKALGNSPEWKIKMGHYLSALQREKSANGYYQLAYQQLMTLRKTSSRQALINQLENLLAD